MELELKKDEIAVIKAMRRNGGHVKFTVEKRPTNENPDGELVRIVIERSELVGNLSKSVL